MRPATAQPASDNQRAELIARLQTIVGSAQVLTDPKATLPFRTGFRFGGGAALAVVRPRSLVEQWRVVQACVAANTIVIMQAANTGLTGGSTPSGDNYDRDIVIINTLHLAKIFLVEEGRQVVCLPGATLYQLEDALRPLGREPHSVIGSSCFGASVMGGISNNSGGALVKRGPAYTQMALYARVGDNGQLQLVNHLGIRLGDDPEQILSRLERGDFTPADVEQSSERHCSDHGYAERVRDIESDQPARYNADPGRLFEASGSAGKVVLFAARLDTFAQEAGTRVFYIGTNDPDEFATLRRHILGQFEHLPIAGEYLHREMFDIATIYGKDLFLTIQHLGTQRMPGIFRFKRRYDAWLSRFGLQNVLSSDKLLQLLSRLMPDHLPARIKDYRRKYEHHLMLKVAGHGVAEATAYLRSIFPSAQGDFFECTPEEATKAFLHRFVAAGAAIRYRAVHRNEVEDIVALDVALRRNDREWFEVLPPELRKQIKHPLYYGHFFCHVFHQDYIVHKGCDTEAVKNGLCALLDQRGAQYPAEHNVGHLYTAKPSQLKHYKNLDPGNRFNPGIGQTSKRTNWE